MKKPGGQRHRYEPLVFSHVEPSTQTGSPVEAHSSRSTDIQSQPRCLRVFYFYFYSFLPYEGCPKSFWPHLHINKHNTTTVSSLFFYFNAVISLFLQLLYSSPVVLSPKKSSTDSTADAITSLSFENFATRRNGNK